MTQLVNDSGTATRVTGTGAQLVTSANAALIGVLCCNSATAGAIQLWAGTTATGTPLTGIITFASGSVGAFIKCPAYASGGLTINVGAAANPDLTLYWNPA